MVELRFNNKLTNYDFVCCGKTYLYYRIDRDKKQVIIKGNRRRYHTDRSFGIAVNSFINKIKRLHYLD